MSLTVAEAQKVALSIQQAENIAIEIDMFIAEKLQNVSPQTYFKVLTMVQHSIDLNLRHNFG